MLESDKGVDVEGIGKSFGSVEALQGISFDVGRGEVVALLGPNGAGKTTTVEILSTLTKPDRGRARVAGHDVVTDPAMVRRSIMLTGQHVALDEMLTGYENLVMFGRLQGLKKSAARVRARHLLGEFDLEHAADRRVGTYSGGMRRRVDIACGLVVRPKVVFLDEPTTGLDPRSRQAIWNLVATFKQAGIATLLTTQYLEEADALADRVVLIDRGREVAAGTPAELKNQVGQQRVDVIAADATAYMRLSHLLADRFEVSLSAEQRTVSVAAPEEASDLARVAAMVDGAGIAVDEVALRRPTLDDAFLALTGVPARDETDIQTEEEVAA